MNLEIFAHEAVLAYLGPGGAVSAIGAIFAAIIGVLIALLGFVWYPIRRMMRKKREGAVAAENSAEAEGNADA
ncbi:MAG: FeoB-associated Cys-rich membrane protein [Haloferula sp.]